MSAAQLSVAVWFFVVCTSRGMLNQVRVREVAWLVGLLESLEST